MSHSPQIWKPETRPQDCWDWITPEDVCRHALAAFYLARESMKQPPGRRFAEADGSSWADRESFGDNLALCFEMRVKTDGYHLGIEPNWATDAKQLQLWQRPPSWTAGELQHPEEQGQPGGAAIAATGPGAAAQRSATPSRPSMQGTPQYQQRSGVWGGAPWERSEADPVLTASTPNANPAGLAPDAGAGFQATANRPCAP